jgi:hypothetical protein
MSVDLGGSIDLPAAVRRPESVLVIIPAYNEAQSIGNVLRGWERRAITSTSFRGAPAGCPSGSAPMTHQRELEAS